MQKTYNFGLYGGLDLVTPPLIVKPGKVLSAKNYEPADEGGYRRMAGYERYDGLPAPSTATYWYLYFDAGTGSEPVATDIVTGLTSTDTAEILSVVTLSGSWGVDAAGYFAVTNSTGLFSDNETLQVSAATVSIADGVPIDGGGGDAAAIRAGENDADDETHLRAAREARRAVIGAVPGSGSINGVWLHKGIVYAFRDNAGATAGVMHKSTVSGWSVVDLGNYIDFTTGAVISFIEGEVITQAVSGATGVVIAVGITSGSFTNGDAAGRLYLKTVTGTFDGTNVLSAPSSATGTSASVLTATTLPVGGKYEFESYNFGGAVATNYMWGVNRVGRGFRFDGTDFAFIHVTGLSDALDKPEHTKPFKKQLFLSFGSSLQHSAVGEPMIWDAIFGAAEIATGDPITGLEDQPGGVLGVFNRNRTYLLYGDDVANWDFVDYSLERGAIEDSIQDLGQSFYADDRGVHNIQQTDMYGDLKMASVSEHIDPLYQVQKTLIIDSVRIKAKNQYRLYYSDKTGILMRWDNQEQHKVGGVYEFMPFELDHVVTSICAEEDLDGFERIFWGSDNGFIYEEKGQSFDGDLIEYAMRMVFCHCGSPRQEKRFHKLTFQVDAPDIVPIHFYPEVAYGELGQPPMIGEGEIPPEVRTGGALWDADFWNQFIWDGQFIGEMEAYIDGQGINISVLVQGQSNYERAHTLKSVNYNFTPRALKR